MNKIKPGDKIMFKLSSSELCNNPNLEKDTWYTVKTVEEGSHPKSIRLTIREFDFVGTGGFTNPYFDEEGSTIIVKPNNYVQEEMELWN